MNVTRFAFGLLFLFILVACGSSTPPPTSKQPSGTPLPVTTELPTTPTTTPQVPNNTPTPVRLTENSGETPRIAFLLSSVDTPRQQLFEQLFNDSTHGITGTVSIDGADDDAATQKQQVEAALAQGTPVLVIQPVDADAAGAYVDAAHKAGAKVIAFDRLINTRDLDAYVSHDLAQTGQLQAKAAVDWITSKQVKKPWNFIFLEGAAGDPIAAQITRGYHIVLDPLIASNSVKIIADNANSDWSSAQAQSALTDDLVKAKNNVDAVLANNSALALGALSALDAQKLTGKVFVAGSGADLPNLRAICNSTQNLELTRDDAAMARAAAKLAIAFANNQSAPDAGFAPNTIKVDDREVFQVAIPVQPITLDSIQAALVQTGIVKPSEIGTCYPPLPTGATVPSVPAQGSLNVWVQEDPTSPVYAYLANLVAAFSAANPDVDIKLLPKDAKTVRDTFADASEGVDILWTTNEEVQQFAASDLLHATDFVTTTVFADPAIAGGTREGTLYGVPVETGNNLLLYYNKKLIKDPPQNTDALIKLAPTLTKDVIGQYTLVYDTTDPFWLLPWLGGYKSSAVDANGRTPLLDTKPMSQTLGLLKTFKDKKVASPDSDLAGADAIFMDGRAAMIINGDEALPAYLAKFGTDLGVTKMPQVSQFDYPHPYTGGMYFAIPAGEASPKLDIVKAFIQFVTSKPIQVDMAKKFHRLPALKDALNDPGITNDAILKGMSDQMLLGIAPPDSSILTCIWGAIKPNELNVLNGTAQPDAAARAMQTSASECVSKLP